MTDTPQNFRTIIVNDPANLPESECKELINAFVELSYKTTGGRDWESYRPAIEGWKDYYNAVGARPQDYNRLVLIYDHQTLVHFTGVTLFELEPEHRFVWMRSSMTLKQYHGAGLLKTAILAVLSPEWLRHLGEVYFIIRTANPIVYEATRNLVRDYAADPDLGLDWNLYPEINDAGELDPVPNEIRDLAVRA